MSSATVVRVAVVSAVRFSDTPNIRDTDGISAGGISRLDPLSLSSVTSRRGAADWLSFAGRGSSTADAAILIAGGNGWTDAG